MAYQVNQSVIDKAKKDYADAQARGDKDGMIAAHKKAEEERAKAGYSGGDDGSQYISLGGSNNSSSNNSSTSSGGSSSGYDYYKSLMEANSKEWHTASEERRRELERQNQEYGAMIGANYNPNTNKWSDTSGNDLYDYSAIVGGTQTPKAQGTPITYYDKQGNPYTGYTIDNKTYKDPYGNARIDVGMLVPSSDGKTWYEMGENGGIAVNTPLFADPEMQRILALEKMLMAERDLAMGADLANLQRVIDEIQNFKPTEAMSYEEARARAEADVGGTFDVNFAQILNRLQQDAVGRGMFGQIPTEAIKAEALANNELNRANAISSQASDLRLQDFDEKRLMDNDYLNRLQVEAGLTQDKYNLEMQQWQQQQEARLNAINMHMQQQADTYNKAMDKLNTLGYADAEVAKALGIPEGTLSTDDRVAQAEFDRQKELMAYEQQLNKEMASYNASLNAKYSGGGGGGGGQDSTPEAEPLMKADAAYKHALDYFQQRYQDTGEGYTQEDVDAYAYQLMWGTFGFDGLEALNKAPGTAMPSGPKNTIGLGGNYIRDYYTNNYSPRSTGSTGYGDDAGYLGSHGKSGIADEDKNAAKDARNDEYIQNLIKNGGLSQAEINNYYNLKR